MSPALVRELRRRIREASNPTRYMVVSEFTRRFILYYDVASGNYVLNRPEDGTLFKSQEVAEAVRQRLGRGISVVRFTTAGGALKRVSPFRPRWGKPRRRSRKGKR